MEYVILTFDDEAKRVRLSLRGPELLALLQTAENDALHTGVGLDELKSIWRPEYGSFMIEGTPGVPYGHSVDDLLTVEQSMAYRRAEVQKLLRTGEAIISLTHFPHMGVADFVDPPHAPGGPIAKSLFVPDEIINPHPRFATLTKNIRERRGRKVDINIPIFMDEFTRSVKKRRCLLFHETTDVRWARRSGICPAAFISTPWPLEWDRRACNVEKRER